MTILASATILTDRFEKRKHTEIVQFILGHSSITQTMDTYSHLLEGVDDDTVDGLEDAFR